MVVLFFDDRNRKSEDRSRKSEDRSREFEVGNGEEGVLIFLLFSVLRLLPPLSAFCNPSSLFHPPILPFPSFAPRFCFLPSFFPSPSSVLSSVPPLSPSNFCFSPTVLRFLSSFPLLPTSYSRLRSSDFYLLSSPFLTSFQRSLLLPDRFRCTWSPFRISFFFVLIHSISEPSVWLRWLPAGVPTRWRRR